MSQHQQQAALPAIILGVNGQQCTHTHAGQQGYRPNQGRLSGNPITGWRSFTTRQQETFSMCAPYLTFLPHYHSAHMLSVDLCSYGEASHLSDADGGSSRNVN